MKCPHLMERITFSCEAVKEIYLPSLFQLEEYCRSMAHKKCPFFLSNSYKNLGSNHFVTFYDGNINDKSYRYGKRW